MARYAIKHSKQLQRTHNLLIILLQLGHNVNFHGRVREHNHLQNAICLRLLFDTVKSGKFPYTSVTMLIINAIYRLQCTNSVLWEKKTTSKRKWIWNNCHPLEIFNCADLRFLSLYRHNFRLFPIQISQPILSYRDLATHWKAHWKFIF